MSADEAPLPTVDVWRIPLAAPPSRADALLSAGELHRAARFRFERHRRRFVARRSALRAILGARLERDPRGLRFETGPCGKPRLSAGTDSLHFSASHSGDLALVAVAGDREVGVDVERCRPGLDPWRIARRFFASEEQRALAARSGRDLDEGFLELWTAKEAYVKALGLGLSHAFDRFCVRIDARSGTGSIRDDADPDAGSRWRLLRLEAGEGYAGALVARGTRFRLRSMDLAQSRGMWSDRP